ncbi:hypothetical protein HZF08_12215 [Paenibacillus sp. CGMCC 1.16610]|uniref:Copper amine oxidase-like N-terminal domain-containing protein n=1 Tax=Paenibacillus anseongense TaxID=2682845 RepID=A0ABW9U6N7_9BACL|nr:MULTISPECIES: stalk domain-containing protein [Paenibacillus]MBA2939074.1 hypothetical protein [Paenibacillus sp. CGMCC 1.16610]MVQ35033.1 hypothetical protein [Paenibacillus anseongense]
MKKLIAGIIIGCTITFAGQSFAEQIQHIISPVTYQILVNGKQLQSNNSEPLNIDGSTYLPLKSIGTALGKQVLWNDTLKRVEIGDVPATAIELTPEERAEQFRQALNTKIQKLYGDYKVKGIELINLDKFAIFMSAKAEGTGNSNKYWFNTGSKLLGDGKTIVQYIVFQGTEYNFTYGIEVINSDDIPAYMGSRYVDLTFLKKFIPQSIIDEYYQAVKDQAWGMGAFHNEIP